MIRNYEVNEDGYTFRYEDDKGGIVLTSRKEVGRFLFADADSEGDFRTGVYVLPYGIEEPYKYVRTYRGAALYLSGYIDGARRMSNDAPGLLGWMGSPDREK